MPPFKFIKLMTLEISVKVVTGRLLRLKIRGGNWHGVLSEKRTLFNFASFLCPSQSVPWSRGPTLCRHSNMISSFLAEAPTFHERASASWVARSGGWRKVLLLISRFLFAHSVTSVTCDCRLWMREITTFAASSLPLFVLSIPRSLLGQDYFRKRYKDSQCRDFQNSQRDPHSRQPVENVMPFHFKSSTNPYYQATFARFPCAICWISEC